MATAAAAPPCKHVSECVLCGRRRGKRRSELECQSCGEWHAFDDAKRLLVDQVEEALRQAVVALSQQATDLLAQIAATAKSDLVFRPTPTLKLGELVDPPQQPQSIRERIIGSVNSPKISRARCKVSQPNPTSVSQLVSLPDGTVASCSWDNYVRVWSHEGRRMLELVGHTNYVLALAFLVETSLLASGSYDGTIRLWHFPEPRLQRTTRHAGAGIDDTTIRRHPPSSSAIRLWHVTKPRLVRTIRGAGPVCSLRALGDGARLASCSHDDHVRVWAPASGQLLLKIRGHGVKWWRLHLGETRSGDLVTCSRDYEGIEEATVRVWSPTTGALVRSVATGSPRAQALLVLTIGRAVVGFRSGQIYLLDLDLGTRVLHFHAHSGGVYALAELPSGLLISGGSRSDPSVKIWRSETGQLQHTIRTSPYSSGFISALSVAQDGRRLVVGSHDNQITIWDLD